MLWKVVEYKDNAYIRTVVWGLHEKVDAEIICEAFNNRVMIHPEGSKNANPAS